jgi:2-polyprenyl-3-methyl-5-hydroxy-6-metoxy-1,4-benzoquinol methylase
MRSIVYLCVSLRKVLLEQGRDCPSCGFPGSADVIDRKWLVTSLRRCQKCHLLYRVPTTTYRENERIYQTKYKEGFTTELPDDATLNTLIRTKFKRSPKDYTIYVDVMRALGIHDKASIYDFGCSWGYGSYQLTAAGFDVEAFEISKPRAHFAADKLGIRLRNPEAMAENSVDVFFSAHVLEHVPSVEAVLKLADRILRAGGWFVAFTPNGSLERCCRDAVGWHQSWGFVHPQLLDQEWVNARTEKSIVVADTDPYDLDAIRQGRTTGKWHGSELLFAYQKSPSNCSPSFA